MALRAACSGIEIQDHTHTPVLGLAVARPRCASTASTSRPPWPPPRWTRRRSVGHGIGQRICLRSGETGDIEGPHLPVRRRVQLHRVTIGGRDRGRACLALQLPLFGARVRVVKGRFLVSRDTESPALNGFGLSLTAGFTEDCCVGTGFDYAEYEGKASGRHDPFGWI